MQESKRRIPHFAYVEEIDVTELEALRGHLNATQRAERGQAHPAAVPDPRAGRRCCRISRRSTRSSTTRPASCIATSAVHIGIATQTAGGLMVPVVRHAETLDLWDAAREIARLAEAARDGKATREELTGSTITITSLGPLGGHRHDAGHQPPGSRDHRTQPHRRAAGRARRRRSSSAR